MTWRTRPIAVGILIVLLLTNPAGAAETCADLLGKLRFYGAHPEQSVPNICAQIEDRHLLVDENARFLSQLCASPEKLEPVFALLAGSSVAVDLPPHFQKLLVALDPAARAALARLLAEGARGDELVPFLGEHFGRDPLDGDEIREIYRSYADYARIRHRLGDVQRPDGTIDVGRLLITGRTRTHMNLAGDQALIEDVHLDPRAVRELIYVIGRNARGALRLSLSTSPEDPLSLAKIWGRRHHSHVAGGDDVILSGLLYLTADGRVRAASLSSGHYMHERQLEIDRFIARHAPDPAGATRWRQAMIERDRDRLIRYLYEFGLVMDPSFEALVTPAQWRAYEDLDLPIRP